MPRVPMSVLRMHGWLPRRQTCIIMNNRLCWTKIYFGTIKAGGHATKDTMMSCSLPAGADDHDIVIKFENVVVTP